MKHLLTATALACILTGLWQHDWRTIIAGAAVAVIWPLISAEVEDVADEATLDELWDDEPGRWGDA